MSVKVWTEEELKRISGSLEGKAPEEAIKWVVDNFTTGDFALKGVDKKADFIAP